MFKRSGLFACLWLCLNSSIEATSTIDDLDGPARQQVLVQGFPIESTFCSDCFTCYPTLIVYEGKRYDIYFHECGEVDLTVFDKMFEEAKQQPIPTSILPAVPASQKLDSPSPLRQLLLTVTEALDDTKENQGISAEIVSKQTTSVSPTQIRSGLLRQTFSNNDMYLLAQVLEDVTNALLPKNATKSSRSALKRSIGSMMNHACGFDMSSIKSISPPH